MRLMRRAMGPKGFKLEKRTANVKLKVIIIIKKRRKTGEKIQIEKITGTK